MQSNLLKKLSIFHHQFSIIDGGEFVDISGVNSSGQASAEIYKAVDVKPVVGNISTSNTANDKKKDLKERVKENIDSLNNALESQNAKYIIKTHEIFGDTMIKIVNKTNNEVLLEIPPEKFLDMIAKLCEIVGLKIDKKA